MPEISDLTPAASRGIVYAHMSTQGLETLADMSMQGIEMLTGRQFGLLTEADYGQWMSEELSYVLSPEDLAVFDQYQASLPGGMLGQQMEAQSANFSAELTEESRHTIRDTLVDVMSSGSGLPSDGVDGLYRQARETLVGHLDNEQLAIYGRFAEQRLSGIRMMNQASEEKKRPLGRRTGMSLRAQVLSG